MEEFEGHNLHRSIGDTGYRRELVERRINVDKHYTSEIFGPSVQELVMDLQRTIYSLNIQTGKLNEKFPSEYTRKNIAI